MCVNSQSNGVTEALSNIPERALPTFSESLKGVAMKSRPLDSPSVSGPTQTPMSDPSLVLGQQNFCKTFESTGKRISGPKEFFPKFSQKSFVFRIENPILGKSKK